MYRSARRALCLGPCGWRGYPPPTAAAAGPCLSKSAKTLPQQSRRWHRLGVPHGFPASDSLNTSGCGGTGMTPSRGPVPSSKGRRSLLRPARSYSKLPLFYFSTFSLAFKVIFFASFPCSPSCPCLSQDKENDPFLTFSEKKTFNPFPEYFFMIFSLFFSSTCTEAVEVSERPNPTSGQTAIVSK